MSETYTIADLQAMPDDALNRSQQGRKQRLPESLAESQFSLVPGLIARNFAHHVIIFSFGFRIVRARPASSPRQGRDGRFFNGWRFRQSDGRHSRCQRIEVRRRHARRNRRSACIRRRQR